MSHSQHTLGKKFKSTATVFLPLFFLILAMLLTFFRQEIEVERKILKRHTANIVDLQRLKITGEFQNIITDLTFFANYQQTLDMLEGGRNSRARLINDLKLFGRGAKIFDQIRILDVTGMEIIRINLENGEPSAVPEDELQFKGNRYYFHDTIRLGRGEVFVSPFDLNIEHGQVEKPLKPTIRFGTPVFDRQNRLKGAILFNYLGAGLLAELSRLGSQSEGESMLLNREGYWISGPKPDEEWGFMFDDRKNLTMGLRFPEAWQKISVLDSGQFQNENGLFTFTTVNPIPTGRTPVSSRRNYSWKIVSHFPAENMRLAEKPLSDKYIYLALFMTAALLVLTWILASVRLKNNAAQQELTKRSKELAEANMGLKHEIGERQKAEAELRLSHEQLELKVEKRTAELSVLNENLLKEIAERKKAEAQLLIAKDAAEAASRAKSDFLRNVSHELRTPMNHILGFTDLVLQTDLKPGQKEKLSTVKSSAGKLLGIINNIIDFSALDQGDLKVDSVDFSLNESLKKLAMEYEPTALEKGLSFSLDISPQAPGHLHGDPVLLSRILGELINNAIKFTETGEVKLTATLQEPFENSPGSKGVLSFSVADTGVGIPEDWLPRLFETFSQADASEERKYGGTGIGLALIRKLAALINGEITVESRTGVGSVFFFRAPFEVAETPTFIPPEPGPSPAQADEPARAASLPAEGLNPDDPEILLAVLEKMEEPLKKRLAKGSKASLAQIQELSWPPELQGRVSQLAGLVKRYKFQNALEFLEEIKAALKASRPGAR